MTHPSPALLTLLMTSAILPSAWAGDAPAPLASEPSSTPVFRIFWENDGAYHNPTAGYDGHYTNGLSSALLDRPKWLEQVSDAIPFWDVVDAAPTATQTGGGLVCGQLLFTPRDITTPAPIADDMGFAGYIYCGGFWQRETAFAGAPHVRSLEHVELNAGLIGPSAKGYQTQQWVHNHFMGRPNDGWRNQVRDEPTAELYVRRKWALDQDFFSAPHNKDYQWDLIPESTLALGTVYDFAEVGCTARFGVNLPRDFGPPRLTDPGTPTANPQGSSFYIYARTSARTVAHDAFTDGSMVHGARTAAGSAINGEPLRADATLGLRWSGDWGRSKVEVGYGLTYQTRQFREQKGTESYGALQLGVAIKF